MVGEFGQFDVDVDAALEATSRGTVDRQLQMMCTLIISIDAKRFGLKQSMTKNKVRPNWREMITQLRTELKFLRQPYRKVRKEERPALTELWDILRKKLISLLSAEWHRRRGRKRACKGTYSKPLWIH